MIRLLALTLLMATVLQAQDERGRLIVLGFDGLDHAVVGRMMQEGSMPHMSRLAARGTFRRLETTNPAQSPVSWAAMTTGMNPGKTGIDGFLRRDFSSGEVRVGLSMVDRFVDRSEWRSRSRRRALLLGFVVLFGISLGVNLRRRRQGFVVVSGLLVLFSCGLLTVSEWQLPDGIPTPRNLRGVPAWWDHLDRAGVPTTTILAPCSFPAPHLDHGKLLCGLGVPDARGTPGFWDILRDDVSSPMLTETGGSIIPLVYSEPSADDGKFRPVRVEGPPNIMTDDPHDVSETWIRIRVDRQGRELVIDNGAEVVTVPEGRWSSPFIFRFKLNVWARVRATARFKAVSAGGPVKIYLEPLSLDPAEIPRGVRISQPENWAFELKERVGPYETLGWACATNALKDGQIDEMTFLEDAQRVWDEQERLAREALTQDNRGVVTVIFTPTDRIQHMFTRYEWTTDEQASVVLTQAVTNAYKRVDHFIGEVMDKFMGPGDGLMVVSDHGFAPWRRAVNLNRFLVDQGLLVLRERTGTRRLAGYLETDRAFETVDWSRTRAYSLGLGKIYLNRKGREPRGIVTGEDTLIGEIKAALLGLRDGDIQVVSSVAEGSAIYEGGAIPEGAADIYVGFNRGYRVSWQSCLGGADEPLLSDNTSAWSGDHCSVDPVLVPGVLATSFPLKSGASRVVDISPSVMAWCGVSPPVGGVFDGRSLLEKP